MALELHDGVLNKMAALVMRLDDQIMTPEFQKSYNELTTQVREMVKDLRPTMLNHGLQLALEGYADTLRERSNGKVRIVADLKSDGARYLPDVEQHVFRIVQEASMNALRHAKPIQITLSGRLEKELIEINVRDDGSGIDSHEKLDLNALQAANHFGMSGIFERAELIGADIKIESELGKGTCLQVYWKPGKI
jgi:signal transduction histidine kinase